MRFIPLLNNRISGGFEREPGFPSKMRLKLNRVFNLIPHVTPALVGVRGAEATKSPPAPLKIDLEI